MRSIEVVWRMDECYLHHSYEDSGSTANFGLSPPDAEGSRAGEEGPVEADSDRPRIRPDRPRHFFAEGDCRPRQRPLSLDDWRGRRRAPPDTRLFHACRLDEAEKE